MKVRSIIAIVCLTMLTSCSQFFSNTWVNDTFDEDCQGCCPPCGSYYKDAPLPQQTRTSLFSSQSNLDSMVIKCPLRYRCVDTFKNDGSASFDSYRLHKCCSADISVHKQIHKHKHKYKHHHKHKHKIYK